MSHTSRYRRPVLTLLALGAAVFALALPQVTYAQGPAARERKLTADIAANGAALIGDDVAAAEKAAVALGNIKDPRALDALLDGLALGLHPQVATAALQGVAEHNDARALDTLQFFVQYRDAGVRAAALTAIGKLDDRRTVSPVLAALRDEDKAVRAIAIGIVATRDLRVGIEPMLELMKKGEEATGPALASMADPDLAKILGEYIGEAPNGLLASTLGTILLREEFKPEAARVQVVRTLGKITGPEAMVALRNYIKSLHPRSLKQSKREAEAIIKARTTGAQPAPAGGPAAPPAAPTGGQPAPAEGTK